MQIWEQIKNRVKSLRNKRASPLGNLSNPPQWLSDFLGGGNLSASGLRVTEDDLLKVSAVYACVNLISNTLASLPLPTYRRKQPRGKERARDHYLYDVLQYEPNPEMTSFDFRKVMQGQLELFGNAYANIVYDMAGRVKELWPIPSVYVRPRRNDSNQLLVYDISVPNGTPRTLLASEMFHLRGFGDGLFGYPPIRYAREIAALALAAEGYGAGFFGRGAVASGIVELPGKLSEQALENFKRTFQENYGGLNNQHRILFLEQGLKFHQTTIQNDNAQFLETRKYQVEEVARFFGVPPHKIGALERATFCLPADAEIFTARGPVRIADIVPGEKVWSRADDGGVVLSRVVRLACTGHDPILTIRTTNRTLRANARHRVLVRRAHERPLYPGEVGGRNIDGRKVRVEWHTEYIPAGDLRVGDTVVALHGIPQDGVRTAPTRIASPEFMEFCGLYLGDGCMTDSHVTIARAAYATYMDYYRAVILTLFQRYAGGNGRGDVEPPTAPVTLVEEERYTRFASVKAVRELRALGFSGTAHHKRVPGWIFSLAEDLRLAFLRGFLDADGSVDKKGRVSFSSCNFALLSGIRHLCISLAIPVTNIYTREGESTLPNGRRTKFRQHYFTCSDPAANRRIGSHTPVYVHRMEAGQPFDRKGRAYPRYGGKGFVEANSELSRIVSIEVGESEPVYDMEVKGTHSFVADGVFVHNSNIEHQSIEFVQDCIRPRAVNWEQQIRRQLLSAEGKKRFYAEFVLDGLLRGDVQSRSQYYKTGRNDGWLSANDIRELENMNPIPVEEGGDAYLINGNMVPITEANQVQEGGDDSNASEPGA